MNSTNKRHKKKQHNRKSRWPPPRKTHPQRGSGDLGFEKIALKLQKSGFWNDPQLSRKMQPKRSPGARNLGPGVSGTIHHRARPKNKPHTRRTLLEKRTPRHFQANKADV
ncbi:hypothetical protein E2C01_053794 [Portunus trituberculatus]|uniref:Uncharacterized protein n=1 Tax=Portunus trituberculatus TaxID=210409 RepID=A0A5B7GQB8_PORTR|nr:hypothetical protein [Portunus trituberculatus]